MSTGYILVDSPNPYQPQGTFPRRGGAKLSGTGIVHTTEGNWRSGVAGLTRLVRTRAEHGCYHQGCDWQDIARYYPWEWETWQDTETNNWAVGIAAACKTSDWGNMPADVEEGYYRNLARMAADFVTYMRDVHGVAVPLRRISGAEARARKPGFAAHGDSGVARSDPGANFDWTRFFNYTRQALGGLAPQGTTTPSKELFTVAQFDEIMEQIGLTHKKVNGMIDARGHDQKANQRWHGQTHLKVNNLDAKTNALTELVGQLAKGQGVAFDLGAVEAVVKSGAKAGATEALTEAGLSAEEIAAAIPAENIENLMAELGKRITNGANTEEVA